MQFPEDKVRADFFLGDSVIVSKKNSLFIDVSNLEGIISWVNLDIYGEITSYDVYFMSLHRTLSLLPHELNLLQKVAV